MRYLYSKSDEDNQFLSYIYGQLILMTVWYSYIQCWFRVDSQISKLWHRFPDSINTQLRALKCLDSKDSGSNSGWKLATWEERKRRIICLTIYKLWNRQNVYSFNDPFAFIYFLLSTYWKFERQDFGTNLFL